jgi:flagellar motor protein MotB
VADKEHDKEHKPHAAHGPPHGGGHEEHHEGAPEWLISFADNVTLMMGFFVILLAINMKPASSSAAPANNDGVPSPAALDMAIALRDAFNNPVDLNSRNLNDLPLIARIRQRRLEGLAENPNAEGTEHDVQSVRPGDRHEAGGNLPFEPDSADLTSAARQAAIKLAAEFRGKRIVIDVRGHTSAEEAFKCDDKGMRLSFDRALTVARFFTELGLDWRQLRIVACGENDRVKPITYEKTGQHANAHVEVVATDEIMPVYTPRDASPTTSPAK